MGCPSSTKIDSIPPQKSRKPSGVTLACSWRYVYRAVIAVVLVGLGIGGAGLVAAIVVSLAGAWGVGEALGVKKSLNLRFGEAKGFYFAFIVASLIGAGLVLPALSLTGLTLDIELLNALVLPLVLGFLLLIERAALPAEYRMRGAHKVIAWVLVLVVVAFGLFMGYDTIKHGFG